MIPRLRTSANLLAAWILALFALAVAWRCAGQMSAHRAGIEARRAEWAYLQTHDHTAAGRRAAIAAAAARATRDPALEDLIHEKTPGVRADIVVRNETAIMDGWKIRHYDVRIDRIDAASLNALLSAFSGTDSALRVVGIHVSAGRDVATSSLSAQLELAGLAH